MPNRKLPRGWRPNALKGSCAGHSLRSVTAQLPHCQHSPPLHELLCFSGLRVLRSPPSPHPHPCLVPTALGVGSAWGFVLSPPEQGLSSQCPVPASPACCKTLNKMSCFSKLCSPHLQNEGPMLPVQVQQSLAGRAQLWLRDRPARGFIWKLFWHCEHLVLTKRKCFLGVAGVLWR